MKITLDSDSYYSDTPFEIHFCFHRVIERLEAQAHDSASDRSLHAQALLREVSRYPELRDGIAVPAQIEQHKGLIGRLLNDFFPESLTRNEIKAISVPYLNIIFNKTERFRNILSAAGPGFDINIRGISRHQFYVMNCCLILNQYYGTLLDFSRPLFYDIPTANGVIKHYRILYNADFFEILPTSKCVELTQEDINLLLDNYDNLDLWKEKFPRESWVMKGFAIMSLFDATVENAVSLLKEKLLKLNDDGLKQSLEAGIRSIYQIPDIQVGCTIYNQEEGAFGTEGMGQQMQSFMLPGYRQQSEESVLCTSSYRALVEEKEYFAVSDTAKFQAQNPGSCLGRSFLSQDIRSFILAPIVRNGELLGVLEVVSLRPGELNSINANKLAVVMPYLVDTIERKVAEMQDQVQAVIQERYTAIHPSVYWKFRDEAQKLLHYRQAGEEYELKEVVLPEVYPLYGQVDIKGSSEARNRSVQEDLQQQLLALLAVLEEVGRQHQDGLFQEEVQELKSILAVLALPYKAGMEQYAEFYIDTNVRPSLLQLKNPALQPAIDSYFSETDKGRGRFHAQRRKYEATIAIINNKMARVLDKSQRVAQAIFPHYYERFKTDGVEHNLYIGASIAPRQNFTLNKLHALRQWQLKVLCEMEIAHHYLKPRLPFPLELTTLVMVYNFPISIRFRMDEKRFDIDGSYSAQYEILKKRIDKAHIKATGERITEAGKVTIVYSNEAEEQEYRGYIQHLQEQRLLGEVVEMFEVEDLQGVTGLKALRVKTLYRSKRDGEM